MDIRKVFIGTLLFSTIVGTTIGQDPLIDFVAYTTKAVAFENEDSAQYLIIGASIIPHLTQDLYIGIALSPLMSGTHYDETPQYRTSSTTTSPVEISDGIFPEETAVLYRDIDNYYKSFRLRLSENRDVSERVGVFHLGAALNGFRTAVVNIPMHSENANVRPIQRGITASVGDSTLTIRIETDETSLRWVKDGGEEIEEWNDQTSVTINDVRLADAGLYECYVSGTRSEGRHAFIIVYVRKCPASKWSPPLCQSTCPLCYNGGVCDADLGICLCRPGFTGNNCETSYGGNHFGFTGIIQCTSNMAVQCSQKIFCGQDPIGCGCASGWNGLACDTECESGMYGNDCLMNCHCADIDCDHSEGCAVNAECDEGFEGERCLTPVISECNAGFYGVFCNLECHCENSEACNRDDASCPGNCEEGWAGSYCLVALPALYDAPSIEYTQDSVLVTWTAWNQDHDFGSAEASSYVLKYWKQSSPDDVITIDNIAELQIEIDISSIEYNQTYSTSVSINANVKGANIRGRSSPVMEFGPVEIPTFLFNPCTYNRLSNFSTTVTCGVWDHDTHTGMGDVLGYTVEYTMSDAPDHTYTVFIAESSEYTLLLPEVDVHYSYEVAIMVNYEYNATELIGPASPSLYISKEKTPDITIFAPDNMYTVDENTEILMRSYAGVTDGENFDVTFGVRLWVDDNGNHYGENELVNLEHDIGNSIFTTDTTYTPCFETSNSVRCDLTFPASIGVRRIGVKYLRTEFNGIFASASIVFLPKEAPIVPEHRTISTSIGETIDLTMTLSDIEVSSLRWKKDGELDLIEWEGLSQVRIENVRRKDDGIYECYQNGHRAEGQHAIVRVIVRECPRGKWMPPGCELDCPVCHNGGVCNEFGLCVCPPGFKGGNCEEACGNNNWGRDCSIICSSSSPGCPNKLFCPVDPLGCSCFTGFKGLECNAACDTASTGMYGPDCLLECHCDNSDCDRTSGCGLHVTCHSGYTGTRCLERDADVECPEGFYGSQCTKICHCRNSSTCDRETGSCPVGDLCAEAWAGLDCQQALPALSDAPIVETVGNNINISWSSWTLDNDYGRGNVHGYKVLFWSTNDTSYLSILNVTYDVQTTLSWADMQYHTEYNFAVQVVTEVDGLLIIGKRSPSTVHMIYPPTLLGLPKLESRSSVGINVTWTEWSYVLDEGIGEVLGYVIEWWDAVAAIDVSNTTFIGEPSEGILIPDIPYDTSLVLRITAIYIDGDGEGLGKPSPILVVQREKCPYDWELFDDYCYLFDNSDVNWDDANSFCQQQNATLVSITSQDENDYVTSTAQDKSNNHIWIGLNFQSPEWHWTSDETFSFQNWQGIIDTSAGGCGKLDSSDGLWLNMHCETNNQNKAVCEKGVQKFGCIDSNWQGYENECYRHFNNLTTRPESKNACQALRNAYLVSIHSAGEDSFVQTLIQHVEGDSWIGLKNATVSDDLIWSDSTTVNYVKSIDTENPNARCVAYTKDNHILSWEFRSCVEENSYVCKDFRGKNKKYPSTTFGIIILSAAYGEL